MLFPEFYAIYFPFLNQSRLIVNHHLLKYWKASCKSPSTSFLSPLWMHALCLPCVSCAIHALAVICLVMHMHSNMYHPWCISIISCIHIQLYKSVFYFSFPLTKGNFHMWNLKGTHHEMNLITKLISNLKLKQFLLNYHWYYNGSLIILTPECTFWECS